MTVITAMAIHFGNGARTFPIFISEADYPGLQRTVFTSGLVLTGLLQMMFAWHLYHGLTPKNHRLWNSSCLLGIIVGFHVILVAYYDMYDHIDPHIYASMVAFGGGIVWATLGHIALDSSTSPGSRLRKTGIATSLISLVVLIVSFQYAVSTFDTEGLTTEEFLNKAQFGINFAGPAEYLVVGGLMMALASFGIDLAGAQKQQLTGSETSSDEIKQNDI
tara:strand:- start:19259 stop:19915 length:657 start_codon:yes stop_codon:yes gene_type:complete